MRCISRTNAVVVLFVCTLSCGGTMRMPCSWGEVCQSGYVCHEPTEVCVETVLVTACEERADYDLCTYPEGPADTVCRAGICEQARCGDGVLDLEEECEGADVGGVTCADLDPRLSGDVPTCTVACQWDVASCTICGDGVVEPTEPCDDGGNADEWDGCHQCTPREFLVNEVWEMSQSQARMGMDGTGGFVAVWLTMGPSQTHEQVVGRRFDAAGRPLTPDFTVSLSPDSDNWEPSVAVAPDGRFVIVWAYYDGLAMVQGIRGRLYDAVGTPVTDEIEINGLPQVMPVLDVAMGVDGRFAVVYPVSDPEIGGETLMLRPFDADGLPQRLEIPISNVGLAMLSVPRVGLAADGSYGVTWVEDMIPVQAVFCRRIDAVGTPLSEPLVVAQGDDQTMLSSPGYAVASNGSSVVAWSAADSDWMNGAIFAQRVDNQGARSGDPMPISTSTQGNQTRPAIGLAGDGSFWVAWTDDPMTGEDTVVRARRFDADDAPYSDDFKVNHSAGSFQFLSDIGVAPDGYAVLIWEGNELVDQQDIFAQRFNADGEMLGRQP